MTRWITVNIEQQHIDSGIRQECSLCPVALALAEATGYRWTVWYRVARIDVQSGRQPCWPLPDHLRDLIYRFDDGETITPTRFRLPARFASDRWRGLGADVEG